MIQFCFFGVCICLDLPETSRLDVTFWGSGFEVHVCHSSEADLHPLILGEGEALRIPSHIEAASSGGELYLGDADAAKEWHVLEYLKISAVVNACQSPNHFDSLKYCSVDVADSPEEDLLMYVDEVVTFIHNALSKGENVLVHCHMGVSRSASLVIAFLGK